MIEFVNIYLKDIQILVAGLIGFVGVIATMIANALVNRKSIERRIAHERNAVRTALKTELTQNRNAYQTRIAQLNENSRFNSTIIPSIVRNDVYKELLGKIGLLSEGEIEKVLNAYQLIEELPYRIKILVIHDKAGSISDDFVRVTNEHNETMKKMHESFLPVIEDAISELKRCSTA